MKSKWLCLLNKHAHPKQKTVAIVVAVFFFVENREEA